MKPDPSRALQGVAVTLLTSVMSEIKTPFGMQTVGLAGQMTLWLAEEAERGADRLVIENRATRELLAEGLSLAGESQAEVAAALATPPARDYKISSLQAENDALRRGLVVLHAAVESAPGSDAHAFNERIWDELVESTKRRQFAARLG